MKSIYLRLGFRDRLCVEENKILAQYKGSNTPTALPLVRLHIENSILFWMLHFNRNTVNPELV